MFSGCPQKIRRLLGFDYQGIPRIIPWPIWNSEPLQNINYFQWEISLGTWNDGEGVRKTEGRK